MNEIQDMRVPFHLAVMIVSACAIIWQTGTRARTAAILKPLFLSSLVALFVFHFAVGPMTKYLIVYLSLIMPFFYMIAELLFVHGSEAAYQSDSHRRRMLYRFIYFLGLAAALAPYLLIPDVCEPPLPLDMVMGVSVFIQFYCLSLQMRRWIDFVEEPEEK